MIRTSGSRLVTTAARKKSAPTTEADLSPWTAAYDLMPLFWSPGTSAIAFTTSLPTPQRSEVAAMNRRSEPRTSPPETTPP